MRFEHNGEAYELPDSWWAEAGMPGFRPTRSAYRTDVDGAIEIAVSDVAPLRRKLAHGVFRDRETVQSILSCFLVDRPLPPVEVLRSSGGPHRFELYDGAHRFYCSVAAGFAAVPALDVTDRRGPGVVLD